MSTEIAVPGSIEPLSIHKVVGVLTVLHKLWPVLQIYQSHSNFSALAYPLGMDVIDSDPYTLQSTLHGPYPKGRILLDIFSLLTLVSRIDRMIPSVNLPTLQCVPQKFEDMEEENREVLLDYRMGSGLTCNVVKHKIHRHFQSIARDHCGSQKVFLECVLIGPKPSSHLADIAQDRMAGTKSAVPSSIAETREYL